MHKKYMILCCVLLSGCNFINSAKRGVAAKQVSGAVQKVVGSARIKKMSLEEMKRRLDERHMPKPPFTQEQKIAIEQIKNGSGDVIEALNRSKVLRGLLYGTHLKIRRTTYFVSFEGYWAKLGYLHRPK